MQSWQSAPVVGGQQPAQAPARPAPQPTAQPTPRRIYGAPEAPKVPDPVKPTETFRTLTAADAAAMGLPAGGTYQVNDAGKVQVIQAAPNAKDGGAVPQGAFEKAESYVSQFATMANSLDTFKDDFAGNTLTGGVENTIQQRFGSFGTPGQSQWWAEFKALDNQIRNDLFGSALTPTEKQAYSQTTVEPDMDPKIVRENLAARVKIIQGALERRKAFFTANGYKPEAVEAIFAPLSERAQASAPPAGNGDDNTGAANAQLEAAFNNGASKEELLVLARQLGVTLPDPAQLDALFQYRAAGGKGSNFFSRETPPPPPPAENDPAAPDPLASKTFGEFGRFMNAFGQVSGDTFGIGDEMAGVGGALGAVLRGEDVSQGYDQAVARDKARSAAAEEYMGNWTLPIQLLTGGAGGKAVSGVSATLNAARRVAATGAPVTRQAVQSSLTARAAGSGAALGGFTGAANGETLSERGRNALLGVGFGAGLSAFGQSVSNRLGNRALAAAPAANPGTGVQQAADRLGVDVIPAVTGGTTTRMLTSGAKQGFISARPIDKAIDRMEGQALAARENIADNIGTRLDPEDAGNVIRTAGNVFSERTGRIGGKLYDRVERLGNGQKFALTEGIKKADEWLADVGRSVQGKDGKIYSEIKKLRDSMASGDFDVMSIPRTRDEFRALLQETNLRGTTLDTAVKQILREAEGDILNGLVQSGNTRAAQAFKTASEFWAKRVETIDDFFNPILGKNAPRSGEQVVTALERLANPKTGNASQLVGIMKAMPPREAASVQATIINRMGRATAGSANNLDDATFSFGTFMTNWNNMSPRAKAAMFPPEHRQALNDLATLSRAVKEAGSSANRSNTAGAVTVQAAISAPQLYFLEPLTAVGLSGGQYAVGRLLASPKFARILARAPRQNTPQARQAFSQQLSGLARTEPALARELGVYQRALTANDNNAVGTLAAEQEDQQPAN